MWMNAPRVHQAASTYAPTPMAASPVVATKAMNSAATTRHVPRVRKRTVFC